MSEAIDQGGVMSLMRGVATIESYPLSNSLPGKVLENWHRLLKQPEKMRR